MQLVVYHLEPCMEKLIGVVNYLQNQASNKSGIELVEVEEEM